MTSRLDAYPQRPPSEVEWEELLVKYEITPRALRLAAEDAGPGRAGEIVGTLEALLAKVKAQAGDGRHERFKSTIDFDGPYHRKQHGFAE